MIESKVANAAPARTGLGKLQALRAAGDRELAERLLADYDVRSAIAQAYQSLLQNL